MKKLIAAAILSIIAAGATAGNASAALWPFNLCCHDKCTVKVRPYNAFTPACFGTMYCDGCMPIQPRFPGYPQASYSGSDGCGLGQLPATVGAPVAGQPPAPLGHPTTSQVMPQGMLWPGANQPVPQYYNYPVPMAPNAGR